MYSNKSSADFLIRHLGNLQKHVTIEISVQIVTESHSWLTEPELTLWTPGKASLNPTQRRQILSDPK